MNSNPRLNELIDLYFNQRLDDVGRFELEELLREDSGNRREFWRRAEIEGLLQEWGRSHEGVEGESRIGMAAERPGRWWSRWPGKALGIAAAVALAASFWIHQVKERVRPSGHDTVAILTDVFEQSTASGNRLPAHWLATSKRHNEHPDLLLRYTFDDVSQDLLRVPNQAIHAAAGLDGTIGGASVREGRWPSKKALEFARRFDGVRVNVPGSYESITMTAWIQLHGLDHLFSGLFMSDGLKKGGFHWQIMDTGALQMGVLTDNNIYASPPAITSEDFGKWLHVAVVYDLREHCVKHFLNGSQVARIDLQEPADPVEIRSGMIGNWDPADAHEVEMIRNFRGRIDDFAIYRKALSDDEIKRLHDEGRN